MRRKAISAARLGVAACLTWLIVAGSGTAFAGEITGNGKVLKNEDGTLNGRSNCAYSGQEDDQFLDSEGELKDDIVRGDPAHAQSWGQIPKEVRDQISLFGFHPGDACNPNIGEPGI